MKFNAIFRCLSPVAIGVLLMSATPANADSAAPAPLPFVSPVFGDNMVLQRDAIDRVWGWTNPGSSVTVSIAGKSTTIYAGKDGKWLATIGPIHAGGPYTLAIDGPVHASFSNVMIGDVWICSGQSNMEMGVGASSTGADAIASANYPQIRLMHVPHVVSASPKASVDPTSSDFDMKWKVCSPDTVGANGWSGWSGFSAVGYYFGRHLYNSLKVPIGLIQNPWSGMPAESFVSAGTLSQLPSYKAQIDELAKSPDQATQLALFQADLDKWSMANDSGTNSNPNWSSVAFDDSKWGDIKMGSPWEQAGIPELANFDGLVWYRKTFIAPASWAGKDLALSLGSIDDIDTTFVNGVKVGGRTEWNAPRTYTVPGSLVVAGLNVISVRVLDTGGGGGIWDKPSMIYVAPKDSPADAIQLGDSPWKYKISKALADLPAPPVYMNVNSPATPTVLYNGMVNPLMPMAIKGVIWYQGESNAGRAREYQDLMPALIADWRQGFKSGPFPFLLVQLASFAKGTGEPVNTQWAELREAQLMTVQKVPNTGMAVAIDIGDPADIHPKDKQDVGDRLALAALAIGYGQKIEYSGPIYSAMKISGSKATLTFTHADGLTAKGGELTGFTIAGPDHVFVPATAVIDHGTVVVSAPGVPNPVAVRYAFEIYPAANLYNAAGLPASPFRTD